MMCRLLNISRSGYYAWSECGESARVIRDGELLQRVCQGHLESRGVYGARKIQRELVAAGDPCGRHKIAKLMHQAGLKGCPKRRFRLLPEHPPSYPIAPNVLNQDYKAAGPNQRWASEITFVATRQGWLYLAVVMDLYSRRIAGRAMDRYIGRNLVMEAMTMGLGDRQPSGGLLHHSDRGPQYTSDDFRDLLDQHGIQCRMSARGHCYDNAPLESFFALLKRERIRHRIYPTREEAKADIFNYIEVFYNRRTRHAPLEYLSPVEFENRTMRA